jgi:hypothetical protein
MNDSITGPAFILLCNLLLQLRVGHSARGYYRVQIQS